jgi:long-chain acyl-CoA synthetase
MPLSRRDADAALTAPGQPFETVDVEVRGLKLRGWKATPLTLVDVLQTSRSHGDATFIVYEDEHLSFDRHFRTAAHLAHVLRDRFGVQPGDRVAIAMRNFPEWSVAFWAAAAAGAVVVPLNGWWSAAELRYGLEDSGSTVLFCDAEREIRLAAEWAGLPALRHVIIARPGAEVGAGHHRFDDVVGEVPAEVDVPVVAVDTDDDATIFYTSGTTGSPKGALGTHRNICTNPVSLLFVAVRNAVRAGLDPAGDGSQGATLLSVPLFHATGCHSILLTSALVGGKIVMMHRWDPGRALELIEQERITTFGGVPAMVMQVLDHPDFETRDTSSVKSVGYGGAPAPPDLVRRIGAHFPVSTPSNGYGLTETSSMSTMNQGADYVAKPDSVGPPVPIVDVCVVDPGGAPVPDGATGELWVKGPNVIKGYWHKPEATAAAITDGWLHTGDVARLDDEGFVYIVDRAKDMLIRGGENIYCIEIETVLYDHPAVADAAVIGIPHDVLGEEVGAVIQRRAGIDAGEAELQTWVAGRLAAFKVPVRIWFTDEPLPRNPAGKILKRQLRDEVVATS